MQSGWYSRFREGNRGQTSNLYILHFPVAEEVSEETAVSDKIVQTEQAKFRLFLLFSYNPAFRSVLRWQNYLYSHRSLDLYDNPAVPPSHILRQFFNIVHYAPYKARIVDRGVKKFSGRNIKIGVSIFSLFLSAYCITISSSNAQIFLPSSHIPIGCN